MSEETIISQCSPTLAGLKTGNMFIFPYSTAEEMRVAVRRWNRAFSEKGLRVLPLKYNGRSALIYLYRPSMLSRDLQNKTAYNILTKCGYGFRSPETCIAQLIKRMADCGEFPHEVGLFLGYPPEDVEGFIENKARSCKLTGYWKVYSDEEKAKKIFAKYSKCTRVYTEQYAGGKTIERLTVAG